MRRFVTLLLLSLASMPSALAIDIYNPANNQLTLQTVDVSGTTYSDVVLTVGNIVGVLGGTPEGLISSYNPALNQLAIPSVQVNNTTYTNVVITVGQVLSVGDESVDGDFTSTLVVTTLPN